ncbi:MAG: DUF5050 domain-containing protein [Planctomycetales bacterium]|nr:DUF5050 domain-containing protein [Planctomycetales bacterium]
MTTTRNRWLRRLTATKHRTRRTNKRRDFIRPLFEQLECRRVLATFNLVAGIADGSPGSLRDAIAQSNLTPEADTIYLASGVYSVNLAGSDENAAADGDLDVDGSISINGVSAGSTTIDATGLDERLLNVLFGATLELTDLTLTNASQGAIQNGGTVTLTNCIISQSGNSTTNMTGGGISNNGELNILNSTIANNTAVLGAGIQHWSGNLTITNSQIINNEAVAYTFGGGGAGGGLRTHGNTIIRNSFIADNVAADDGGGISSFSSATIDIADTSIHNNASGRLGGGITSLGKLVLNRVEVSSNRTGDRGGGLFVNNGFAPDPFSIANSTISGNTSDAEGGGISFAFGRGTLSNSTVTLNTADRGGGLHSESTNSSAGPLNVGNTIVAQNTGVTGFPDIFLTQGEIFTSLGNNLIGVSDTTFDGFVPGSNNDQIGSSVAPIDAKLETLALNGGPTKTHALMPNSPAIDAGVDIGSTGEDQRGDARPLDGDGDTIAVADIGAFEYFESRNIQGYKFEDLNGDSQWNRPDSTLFHANVPQPASDNATLGLRGSFGNQSLSAIGGADLLVTLDPAQSLARWESLKFTSTPKTSTFSGNFQTGVGAGTVPVTLQVTHSVTIQTDRPSADLSLTAQPGGEYKLGDFFTSHCGFSCYDATISGTWTLSGPTETISAPFALQMRGNGVGADVRSDLSADASRLLNFNFSGNANGIDYTPDSLVDATVDGARIVIEAGNFSFQLQNIAEVPVALATPQQGNGEPPLSGWTIYVDANNNSQLDAGERATTTEVDGSYTLESIPPGSHVVREVLQAGYAQTLPGGSSQSYTVDLSSSDASNVDFGNRQLGAITGVVYDDLNANGQRDSGEPGLVGVTVFMDDNHNGLLDVGESQTFTLADDDTTSGTNERGQFRFDGLLADNYRVTTVLAEGRIASAPATSFLDVSLAAGETRADLSLGSYGLATIAGYKFEDLDGDGQWNHIPDDLYHATITAPASGNATFRVGGSFGSPTFSPRGGLDIELTLDAVAGTARYESLEFETLSDHQVLTANIAPSGGGPEVPVTLTLDYQLRVETDRASQDLNVLPADGGGYQLDDFYTSHCNFRCYDVFLTGTWTLTGPTETTNGTIDSSMTGIGVGADTKTNLSADATQLTDFRWSGNYNSGNISPNPIISSVVDGAAVTVSASAFSFSLLSNPPLTLTPADPGGADAEPGLANWQIFLDRNSNGTHDGGEPSTTTNARGYYEFVGLMPGSITVAEESRPAYLQTAPGDPSFAHQISLDSSEVRDDLLFGNRIVPGEIEGVKFEDLNGNGVRDAGEPGLAGWTIYVDEDDDGVFDIGEPSNVTASDGSYRIDNVLGGEHNVREVLQNGWQQSVPTPLPSSRVEPNPPVLSRTGVANATVSSDINSNTTWTKAAGPYLVTTPVTVAAGTTLTVEPGVEVLFDAGARLDVEGALLAIGTSDDPILFTSSAATPAKSDWYGLDVKNLSGGHAALAFVTVEYASTAMRVHCCSAQSPATVTDSVFRFNHTGFGGYASAKVFIDRTVFDNNTYAITRADKEIRNSLFTNNDYGLYQTERISVYGSTFENNGTALYGGRGTLQYNRIANNTVGIQPFYEGFTVLNNEITGNEIGFTLATTVTIPAIQQNVISSNTTFDVTNPSQANRDLSNNHWGTTNTSAIGTGISDGYDGSIAGLVEYEPILANPPNTTPLVSGSNRVTVAAGTTTSDVDFGNFQFSTISGVKFDDVNANGVQDSGEQGLEGWTLFIDANDNGELDKTEARTVSSSDGSYSFTNLPPGEYHLREVAQPGWQQTLPTTTGAVEPILVWANSIANQIQGANLDGSNLHNITPHAGFATDVALDLDGGKVYWATAQNSNSIRRSNLDGSDVEVVYTGASSQFGLDLTNGMIYFVTAESGFPHEIRRMELDGSNEVLITNAHPGTNVSIADLAVDPVGGKLYWTATNGVSLIVRSNLDGSSIETIVANASISPRRIALDTENNHLYWSSNDATNSILRSDLDGANVVTLISGVQVPFGFDVDPIGDKLYWTNGDSPGSVQRSNLDGSAIETIVADLGASVNSAAFAGLDVENRSSQATAQVIAMASGGAISNVDFGNHELDRPHPVEIHGVKFNDLNANGVKDSGEPGLSGWTIYLDLNGNRQKDSNEPSQVTTADGSYSFTNLAPGTYTIGELQKPDWQPSSPELQTPLSPIAPATSTRSTSATTSIAGGIFNDTVWTAADSPYHVTSSIIVYPDVQLTVEPGVEIWFDVGTELNVRGHLEATGTAAAPILFTSSAASPARGDWSGVRVLNTFGGTANFKFATLEYASSAIQVSCCGDAPVDIQDSTFRHNQNAFSGYTGSPIQIVRSLFDDNTVVSPQADRQFYDSIFTNNGTVLQETERHFVSHSVFTGNQTAIDARNGTTIEYSTISGNQIGVSQAASSGALLRFNEISGNDIGVQLATSSSQPLTNNNIFGNTTYNLENTSSSEKNAGGNYWGTQSAFEISQGIFDSADNSALGTVLTAPIALAALDVFAPASNHQTVTAAAGATITNVDFGAFQKLLVSFTTGSSEATEGAGVVQVEAILATALPFDLQVPFSVSGSALASSDYTLTNPFVYFPAGSTTGSTTLIIEEDVKFEADDTIVLTLQPATDTIVGAVGTHTLTILDNDPAPQVSFQTAGAVVDESAGTVNIGVRLTAESDVETIIPLVFSGSATNPNDYTLAGPTTITIPAGSLRGETTLSLVDDPDSELTELIVAGFGTPTNATLSSAPGDPLQHVIRIPQNDAPNVGFVSSGRTVTEGTSTVVATLRLSAPSAATVTVPYSVASSTTLSGSEYSLNPGSSVVFAPGETAKSITINLGNDSLDEPTEYLRLLMGNPENAVATGGRSFTVAVRDNDVPRVSFTQSKRTVWEDQGTVTITAKLSIPSSQTISVPISRSGTASYSSDYTMNTGSFVFSPGQTSVSRTITVVNNSTSESATESLSIRLRPPSGVLTGSINKYTLNIKDDDAVAYISTGDSFKEVGSDNSTTVTIRLNKAINKTVTIPLSFSGTARRTGAYRDYIASATSVTIPAGKREAKITLTGINDNYDESTETIKVSLKTPTNAKLAQSSTSRTMRLYDTDVNYVYFSNPEQWIYEGRYAYVYVRLSRIPTKTVTVPIKLSKYSTAESNDHNFSNQTLVFKPGETVKKITIKSTHDTRPEPQDTVQIYISSSVKNVKRVGTKTPYAKIHIRPSDGYGTVKKTSSSSPSNVNASPPGTLAFDPNLGSVGLPPGGLSGLPDSQYNDVSGIYSVGQLAISGTGGGYIAGATAFFDANFNEIADYLDLNGDNVQTEDEPTEFRVVTNDDGSFEFQIPEAFDTDLSGVFEPHEGQTVIAGGVDGATLLPFIGQWTAVPGQYLLSPTSTLVTKLVAAGLTAEEGRDRIIAAFELPDEVNLETLNPISATINGDANAPVVFAMNAQLFDTTVQAASLFSGVPAAPSVNVLVDVAYQAITDRVQEADSVFDPTDVETISSLLNAISFRTGLVLPETVIADAATVIAAGNSAIANLPVTLDRAYLDSVVRVEKVTQGEGAAALQDVGAGAVASANVVTDFTGTALDDLIASAVIGNVVQPVIVINDVAQRETDGQTIFDFTISLINESILPVSIDYATQDDTADSGAGDYVPTSGELTWEPGDNTDRVVSVTVNGDTESESDELFLLALSNPSNGILRKDTGYGWILNDEDVSHTTATDSESGTNEVIVEINAEELNIVEGDTEVAGGFYTEPVALEITGQDDIDDTLNLDFSANTFRNDVITFHGGGGAGFDTAVINGGEFQTITQSLTNATDGQTVFDPVDSDASVTFNWTGLEPFSIQVGSVDDLIFELPAGATTAVLEDVDSTDATNPGMMQLRSPSVPPDFETTVFPNPTGSLTIRGGNGADTITIASLDAAFVADLIIDGDFSGSDPVAVSIQGTIDVPPLLEVHATSLDVNAAITDTAAVGELRVDAVTSTLNANVVVENLVIAGGTLLVGSSLLSADVTVQDGGTLAGDGTVSGSVSVESGGHIAPGPGVGKLTVSGLNLTSGAQVDIDINGANSGEFDQIAGLESGFQINGAALNVTLGTIPTALTSFPIVVNELPDVDAGAFAGKPTGSTFVVDSTVFQISYPQTDSIEVELRVLNTIPVSIPGGPYSATEGVSLSLDGSGSSDQEDDNTNLKFSWDLDYDGDTFDVDTTGEQPSVVFGDNAVGQVIALRVTDSDGASHIATTTVNVVNENPDLATNGTQIVATVDSQAVNTGTFGDVPADTVRLTASVGDVFALDGRWVWLLDVDNSTPASQTVTITAADEDGGETDATFELVAFSVPPLITSLSGDTTGEEGDLLAYQVEVLNLSGSTLTYLWNFGDGSASVTGNDLASIEHQFEGNGVFPVTVMVFDDPEDTGTVRVLNVAINNALPTVTSDVETITVIESAIANNTGTFGDLGEGAVAVTASRGTITQDNDAGTWGWSLPTADGPDDSGTITITATDSDNAVATTTFELTVNNALPTIASSLATVTVTEGATATNSGTFGDVGDDTVTITASPGIATQDNAVGTWSW